MADQRSHLISPILQIIIGLYLILRIFEIMAQPR